ncbi:MAG: agmatinase [bacterium]
MRIFPFVRNFYSIDEANYVIISIPYEGYANSRLGTFWAPQKIRQYSEVIEAYSNYFNKSLENVKFFDVGNIKIDFSYDNDNTIIEIYNSLKRVVIDKNKKYIFIGGDHSVTIASFWAVRDLFKNVSYIHLDAHADCHNLYHNQKYSHANVLRRISEVSNSIAVGVRTFDESERAYFFSNTISLDLDKIDFIKDYVRGYVYLSVDVDFFDPCFCGAVSNPVSNGASFQDFIKILQVLPVENIVGFDVVEVNPILDFPSYKTSIFASEIIREFILAGK